MPKKKSCQRSPFKDADPPVLSVDFVQDSRPTLLTTRVDKEYFLIAAQIYIFLVLQESARYHYASHCHYSISVHPRSLCSLASLPLRWFEEEFLTECELADCELST